MKKTIALICILSVAAAGIGIYFYLGSETESRRIFAMDTFVDLKAEGFGAESLLDSAQAKIEDLDKNILSRQSDGSQVYELNKNHGGKMSAQLTAYVKTMLEVAQKSDRRFDFTLGALSDLWGFGGDTRVPSETEIKKVLGSCGTDKIKINGSNITIPEGMLLDFGSVGKGIALDELKSLLKSSKVKEAVMSVGGSILLYGDRQFTVGIQDPRGGSGYVAALTVPECSVSTSGSYERYFTQDGKRYHHILDPESGYPAENGLVSVTIVSQSGILSDALSTACFVCGLDDGMKLAQSFDCDAVFIDENNKIYVTENLGDKIEINDKNYVLQ